MQSSTSPFPRETPARHARKLVMCLLYPFTRDFFRSPILFDRNALSYGSDISHTPGSGTFTVSNPGVYGVNFHGVLSPVSGSSFPLNLVTSLTLNGSVVPGASVPYNLQSATDASEQSFFIPVSICSPPANLQVTVSGGNGIADAVTMTVVRLGSVPCSDSST